jgi:hypothetical protein
MRTALSNEQLRSIAPSIFATQPYDKVSDRYSFIPTIDVVEKMRTEGFAPFSVTQSKTRARIQGKPNARTTRAIRVIR